VGFLDRFRRPPDEGGEQPPRKPFAPLRELALAGADLTLQRAAMVDGLLAHGISADTVLAIMENVRDGVGLLELEDSTRRSRIGGDPELPPGEEWPRDLDGEPLTFIATLDLDELPYLDPLPVGGTLLVFWSERYFEWERMDFRVATRVFWLPPGVEPVGVPTPDGANAYESVPLSGFLMPVLGEEENIDVADEDEEPFFEAQEELLGLYGHQLLGASRDIQGPVLDEVSYWFENGFPETREDFTEAELAGEGWMLLGQIDSTGDLMFGDAGAIYLLIPEVDLDARRFDRVLGVMQCS
jgi:uncharacterized protein YwqG